MQVLSSRTTKLVIASGFTLVSISLASLASLAVQCWIPFDFTYREPRTTTHQLVC